MRLWRRSKADEAASAPTEQVVAEPATPPDRPAPGTEGAKPGATADKPGAPAQPVAQRPAPDESIAGLRAWIAQVDRKLGVRTYAGAAAVVLALAAGLVGAYLGATAKDESATKEELQSLRDQLEAVQTEATTAVEESVSTVNSRLDELGSRLNTLSASQRTTESELQVAQDDIDELRTQTTRGARTGGGETPR